MRYPKINSLWLRDEKTHLIMPNQFTCPEFNAIKQWHITEKIHGTNTRIILHTIPVRMHGGTPYQETYLTFKGKTDTEEDNLPKELREYLVKIFKKDKLKEIFPTQSKIVLFGEGYGIHINKGGSYRKDVSFILFDVWIDDWWLEPKNVKDIAKKLNIDYVPELGTMTWEEAEKYCKSRWRVGAFDSRIAQEKLIAEGIVARSVPIMLFRHEKEPIMWKLKVKDYRKLK